MSNRIKLYDMFSNWGDRGAIWLLSDTHFDDPDCKLMDPNWPTPEQHVRIINSKVSKNDTLVILGDVGNVEYVKKLKGYKVLIKGNHDRGNSNYQKETEAIPVDDNITIDEAREYHNNFIRFVKINNTKVAYYDNKLFDEVYDGPIFINNKILLSHEPVNLRFGLNIHGHVHDGFRSLCGDGVLAKYNVCSNVIEYEPIRLDKIVKEYPVKDLHRLNIDKRSDNYFSPISIDKKEFVVPIDDDLGEMLNWAVRYSLGRRTYAVSDTCNYIIGIIDSLTTKTLRVIVEDIDRKRKDRFFDSEPFGSKLDEDEWLYLQKRCKEVLKSRGEDVGI